MFALLPLFRLYRPEVRATLLLGLPIVIAQLGAVLMGVTDIMMVGPLGKEAVAAAGIANPVFFLVAVLGIGTVAVIAPQVSLAQAQGDPAELVRLRQAGVRLGLGLGTGVALVLLLLSFRFEWLRQPPEVARLAVPFLRIVALSAVPMLLFLSLKAYAEGLGHTQVAMYCSLGGLVLNLLLNWLLVYGHWGFPAWGVYGSATATLLARTGMAAAMWLYLQYSAQFAAFRNRERRPWQPVATHLLRLGLPGGLQLFFEVAAFSAAAIMGGWLGTVPLAAHEIAINLASVTYLMAAGLSTAGAIRVGRALGSGDRGAMRRAGTVSLGLTLLFMGLTAILFLSLPHFWVSLYSIKEPAVATLAASLVVIAGLFQLSDGVQVAAMGILRGLSDVNGPTVIALVAYWVIALPVGYGLAFTLGWGAEGIWYGLLIGLTASAGALTLRFYAKVRRVPLRPGPASVSLADEKAKKEWSQV